MIIDESIVIEGTAKLILQQIEKGEVTILPRDGSGRDKLLDLQGNIVADFGNSYQPNGSLECMLHTPEGKKPVYFPKGNAQAIGIALFNLKKQQDTIARATQETILQQIEEGKVTVSKVDSERAKLVDHQGGIVAEFDKSYGFLRCTLHNQGDKRPIYFSGDLAHKINSAMKQLADRQNGAVAQNIKANSGRSA